MTSVAQIVTEIVPARSGRTPKSGGSNSGAQRVPVMKSMKLISRKNSIAGWSSAMTMPTVVATEMNAQTTRDDLDPVLAEAPLAGAQPGNRLGARVGDAVRRHDRLALAAERRGERVLRGLRARPRCGGMKSAASVIAALLSRMYCTKAATSGLASDSFFT